MPENNSTNLQKKNKVSVSLIVAILAIIIAGLGIWGIIAYFTASDSAENIFTVGNVDIELLEPNWVPGNATQLTANEELPKDPQIKNKGSNDAYVYLKVSIPKAIIKRNSTTKEELFTVSYNGTNGINTNDWNILSETEEDDVVERVYYYKQNNGILPKNTTSSALFDTIKLANITDGADLEGRSFNVKVDAYAIQGSDLVFSAEAITTEKKVKEAWDTYWAQDTVLNQLAVTFDTNGGSTVNNQYVRTGNTIVKPADPTNSNGYIFDGWYKEDTFENLWDFSTDTVSENTTLYAKWAEALYFQLPTDWYGTTVYVYPYNSATDAIDDNSLPKSDSLLMTLKDSNKNIYQYKLTQSQINNINNYDKVIFYNDGYVADDNDLTERRTVPLSFSSSNIGKIYVPELYNSNTNMRMYGYATNMYEYLWYEVNGNQEGSSNATWPGVQMTNDTVDGIRYHERIIDISTYNRMIINNGKNNNQSTNITIPVIYDTNKIAQDLTFKISSTKVEPNNDDSKVYYYKVFRCIYNGSWQTLDTWISTGYSTWNSTGDGAKFRAAQTALGYK